MHVLENCCCMKHEVAYNIWVMYIYISGGHKWSMTNAQISQKQDGHNVYVIIKTMCPLGYHHDEFVATHALVYIMYRSSWLWFIISSCMVHTIHHVPKCMSCHKEVMVITGGHIVFIITYKQKPSVCMCCTMAKVFF